MRQEAYGGDQQQRRVQRRVAKTLGEAAELLVIAVPADRGMDGVPDLPPAVQRRLQAVHLRVLDAAVEGDPGHDLAEREMTPAAARFPQALVRLLPHLLQVFQQGRLQGPGLRAVQQLGGAGLVQGVQHLPVHVQLQLRRRGVADAHRGGALVARQPGYLVLLQQPFAGDAVHDLHLVRAAGDAAVQPAGPGPGFLGVPSRHEGEQGDGGVAQPAEAVVPVPHAAQRLRQRRGGRCDDAAGRRVGQALQRQQGPLDRLGPRTVVSASGGPVGPVLLRRIQRVIGVQAEGRRQMRRAVGEHEGHPLAFPHGELGDGAQVPAVQRDRGPQHHQLRPGDGHDAVAVVPPRDPGDGHAVVEAQGQVQPHRHGAALALDNPDQGAAGCGRHHEINEDDLAALAVELGFQHQAAVAVAAGARRWVASRGNLEAAVLRPAQQGGEAGGAVEAGPAQPVYAAVAPDQRRGGAVSDQGVILDVAGRQGVHAWSGRREGGGGFTGPSREHVVDLSRRLPRRQVPRAGPGEARRRPLPPTNRRGSGPPPCNRRREPARQAGDAAIRRRTIGPAGKEAPVVARCVLALPCR